MLIALLAVLVTAPLPLTVTPPAVPDMAIMPKPPPLNTLPLPVTATLPLPRVKALIASPLALCTLPFWSR